MQQLSARARAFSIHFVLSVLVFAIILYGVLLDWFPGAHFFNNGGWQGIRILLPVFLIIGPGLTLLLFRPGKSFRAIVFDLVCVSLFQISALGWGIYTMHTQRPVGMSLSAGIMYPLVQEELFLQNKTPADMEILDDGRPPVVFARAATTDEEQLEVIAYDMMQGIPEEKLFQLFEPISKHKDELFSASLDNINPVPDTFLPVRDAYLERHRYQPGELAFIPFEGRYGKIVLVFNRNTRLIDFIPNPRHGN